MGDMRQRILNLFIGIKRKHCKLAYEYATGKRNFPDDMRG